MTKLEWCRQNAPEALKDLPDAELLSYMQTALSNPDIAKPEFDTDQVDPYAELLSAMDYMVLTLVREFGDQLAFKGGYMLSKLIPNASRQTTDIDFSIQTSELYTSLITAFERIGNKFVADGFIQRYDIKQEIRPFMSGGMVMYDESGKRKLGIDVGWHDITCGTTSVTLDIATVRAFSVERMLADKVTAILSRKRFRRPKDLYDVYCITNCFNFDGTEVNKLILHRTENNGADWQNYPFNEIVIREYEKAYNSLSLTSVSNDARRDLPAFSTVFQRFDCIAWKLRNPDLLMTWNHETGMFEVGV